ncbi:zinc finger protein 652-like [Sabethes cyaneus]|uniref:zinc finger protein 652-like n=1 Tax=Sabethes cyaneus TaxID=53552 RepID=UPI00237ED80B|nr:zinc finger protein 652-like [Sabethes cyaneus]
MTEQCCRCNLPKETPKVLPGSASFRYICRLCLMRAEDVEPIFIHPGDRTLANKILACTGVEIDENAAVGPSAICISCKTSVYKSYQFLELCQRNNKIIQNLLASHDTKNSTPRNELRMVIRPIPSAVSQPIPENQRKRTLSRRQSTRSYIESSTSASDITWSDCDDEENEQQGFDDDGQIRYRQVAYDTDTQEESPKRPRLGDSENRVPALVIPMTRLNGFRDSSQSYGRDSRNSTIDQTGENDLFQCEFCDGSFPYRIQIKQHIDLYHANRKNELACKFCSKTYFTTDTLRRHTAEKHASTILRECKLCNRSFTSAQGLHQHYRSLIHRAATGEAVYPRRRHSYRSDSSRRDSICSYVSDNNYKLGESRTSRKSYSHYMDQDDYNPYADVYYDEVTTYKCDYCDARFDDAHSLAKHTAVKPCRVELEPLNLDLLLERMDLDELLQPLNNIDDVAIIEPPIEIVDLT